MRAMMPRLHSRAPSFLPPRERGIHVQLPAPRRSEGQPRAPSPNDWGTVPCVERVMGIEPTSSAWKAEVLPLNYTRWILCRFHPPSLNRNRPGSRTLVEGVGFEPTKAEPPDLQSGPFGRSGTPPQRKRHIVLDGSDSVKQKACRHCREAARLVGSATLRPETACATTAPRRQIGTRRAQAEPLPTCRAGRVREP